MGAWLLSQPFAHGDLKPENILVRNDGTLVMVDYDGMFVPAMEGEWFHFDLTPGEYEIRRGAADYTGRLCVIGSKLKEDKLEELFLLK